MTCRATVASLISSSLISLFAYGCYGCGDNIPAATLEIESPARGLFTTQDSIVVRGKASAPRDISQILINKHPANLSTDGTFELTLELEPGTHSITTELVARGADGIRDTRGVTQGELAPPAAVSNGAQIQIGSRSLQRAASAFGELDAQAFQTALAAMPFSDKGIDCTHDVLSVAEGDLVPTQPTLYGRADGLTTEIIVDNFILSIAANYMNSSCIETSGNLPLDAMHIHISWPLNIQLADGAITLTAGIATPDIDHPVMLDGTGIEEAVRDRVTSGLVQDLVQRIIEITTPSLISAYTQFTETLTFSSTAGGQFKPAEITTNGQGLFINYDIDFSTGMPTHVPSPAPSPILNNRGIAYAISDDLLDQRLAAAWQGGTFNTMLSGLPSELLSPPVVELRTNSAVINIVDWLITKPDGSQWAIHGYAELTPIATPAAITLAIGDVILAAEPNGPQTSVLDVNELDGIRMSLLTTLTQVIADLGVPLAKLSDDKLLLSVAPGYLIIETKPFMP